MLNPKDVQCSALNVTPEITLFYTGASLDKGEMPALFYFALSGEDSLCSDPFNQLVQFLCDDPIRIFSMNLPGHEPPFPPTEAMSLWADDLAKENDIITHFIDQAETAVRFAIDQGYVKKDKMALAGLSRGGFIASHLAARMKEIRFILEFAPLTDLSILKEFKEIKPPLADKLHVKHLTDHIWDRHIRIYIGNRDLRVGTRHTFDFVERLSNKAFKEGLRSPQIELLLSPSIGHLGHGTSPETFKAGADWISEVLLKNGKPQ